MKKNNSNSKLKNAYNSYDLDERKKLQRIIAETTNSLAVILNDSDVNSWDELANEINDFKNNIDKEKQSKGQGITDLSGMEILLINRQDEIELKLKQMSLSKLKDRTNLRNSLTTDPEEEELQTRLAIIQVKIREFTLKRKGITPKENELPEGTIIL